MDEDKKPKPVEYYDPDGQLQTGYYVDGHVYQDEAGTTPIAAGSLFQAGNGNYYRMTPYGGILWASPRQTDSEGGWLNAGNPWYVQARDVSEQLARREPFSYEPETDPVFLQARGETLRQGRRAMEDTQGQTAMLTGGYASSFSQLAGQQAYNNHLTHLAQLLPELYDRAKAGYDDETRALYDRIDSLLGLYDLDYQTYLDRVGRDQWQQKQQSDQERYDQQRADAALEREQAQQAKAQQEAAAQAERDRAYAYKLVMEALKAGKMPSRELLDRAELDPELAEQIRQYYAGR